MLVEVLNNIVKLNMMRVLKFFINKGMSDLQPTKKELVLGNKPCAKFAI